MECQLVWHDRDRLGDRVGGHHLAARDGSRDRCRCSGHRRGVAARERARHGPLQRTFGFVEVPVGRPIRSPVRDSAAGTSSARTHPCT